MTDTKTDWIYLGKLGKPHGVRGELLFWPSDDSSDTTRRLLEGAEEVEIRWPDSKPPLETLRDIVSKTRMQGKRLIVGLASLPDRTAAEAMPRHGEVWAPAEDVREHLGEGEMLISDLIGRKAVDAEGALVGTIIDVETGPQDQLVIEPEAAWWQSRGHDPATTPPKQFRLPYVDELVKTETPPNDSLTVLIPPGLENI